MFKNAFRLYPSAFFLQERMGMRTVGLIFWHGLVYVQKCFLVASICFLIGLLNAEVIMRYLIHYPGMEVEEIATLVAFWLYFLGASYGTYDRSHIKAELFHLVFKDPRKLAFVRAIATGIALVLAGIMVYWGYLYFIWGITKVERSRILLLPMAFAQTSILVGATLMFLYFLTELVDRICQAMGKVPVFKKEE
mgnify:CR=1 FL=1